MREQIKVYVDGLFKDAALTIRNAEVQQEILQHTLDRYDDLIAAGKSEQEAYDEAVGGIGDVSELYEHKPEAEAPKTRDFPAPPTPGVVFTAPQTPQSGKKKKLPGWAIALICVGAVIAILALNFAGRAVFAVLRVGERYIYESAGSYETLDRTGFGSKEQPAAASELLTDITEIEIHWLTGDVYLVESNADGVAFQEDYTGDNEDYRMRYRVSDGKLIIQPCKSRLFSNMDLPRKALTVFLPDTLTLDNITVETVSANVELMGGSVDSLTVSTTSGNITGPGLLAEDYDFGTVSGDISLTAAILTVRPFPGKRASAAPQPRMRSASTASAAICALRFRRAAAGTRWISAPSAATVTPTASSPAAISSAPSPQKPSPAMSSCGQGRKKTACSRNGQQLRCWPKLFLCLLPLAATACFFAAPDNAGDHEEQDHCGNGRNRQNQIQCRV